MYAALECQSCYPQCHWWVNRMEVSAGGGPPCETYTSARSHDDNGPRQLRSKDHPHGIPGLTMREWAIGGKLLRFLLRCSLSWPRILEHPQYPTWLEDHTSASIWALETVRCMKQMHCVSIISYDHCTCGALGRKPTTLLLVCLPDVRHELLLKGIWGRCSHAPDDHGPLIGRQSDSSFNTAKAKKYPVGMNEVIWRGNMFRFAVQFADTEPADSLPAEVNPYLEQSFQDHCTVQPDFHGN